LDKFPIHNVPFFGRNMLLELEIPCAKPKYHGKFLFIYFFTALTNIKRETTILKAHG